MSAYFPQVILPIHNDEDRDKCWQAGCPMEKLREERHVFEDQTQEQMYGQDGRHGAHLVILFVKRKAA